MFALESAKNARSFKGIKTKYGIINNKLFRSGRLNALTKKDKEVLLEHNIKTVIDFRTLEEQQGHPDTLPEGVKHISNPALDAETMGITRNDKAQNDVFALIREGNQTETFARDYMESTYLSLISNSHAREAFKKMFSILLTEEDGILWHCTVGKDRAGIASALVLLALGVDEATIMQNYLETNERLHEENEFILSNVLTRHGEYMTSQISEIFHCYDSYLQIIFAYIKNNFASLDEFLLQNFDLTKEKREIIIKKFTEM